MAALRQHISRHTAILFAGLTLLSSAAIAFLFLMTPRVIGALESMTSSTPTCGCETALPLLSGSLLALSVVGLLAVTVFLIRFAGVTLSSVWQTLGFLKRMQAIAVPLPPILVDELRSRKLQGQAILVPHLPGGLLTVGFFKPMVLIDQDFLGQLSHDELRAVFAHEAEHIRRRDPLRELLFVSTQACFGFLPFARRAIERLSTEIELSADAAATGGYVDVDPLSRAFLKVTRFITPRAEGRLAATAFSVNAERLEQLLNPSRPLTRSIPTLLVFIWSLVVSVSLLGLLVPHAMARPATVDSSAETTMLCPRVQCEGTIMSPAPNVSTDHGMCTGQTCH